MGFGVHNTCTYFWDLFLKGTIVYEMEREAIFFVSGSFKVQRWVLTLALSARRISSENETLECLVLTHRLLSSSFWRLIFRILQGNPKKELLRSLWVGLTCCVARETFHSCRCPDKPLDSIAVIQSKTIVIQNVW